MAQSFAKTIAGHEKRVIEYTRINGRQKTEGMLATEFGLKGYGYRQWLEKETGDPNFGLNPVVDVVNQNAFDLLANALAKKLSTMAVEIEALEKQNRQLKTEIDYLRGQNALRVVPVLEGLEELCRT